mmetsp:Transcript_95150/g.239751  ORF Transcript_95150/g.239751 Transcript_95150/m.239751 type:complete len:305 (+) Transcript_95150:1447-2361(+)
MLLATQPLRILDEVDVCYPSRSHIVVVALRLHVDLAGALVLLFCLQALLRRGNAVFGSLQLSQRLMLKPTARALQLVLAIVHRILCLAAARTELFASVLLYPQCRGRSFVALQALSLNVFLLQAWRQRDLLSKGGALDTAILCASVVVAHGTLQAFARAALPTLAEVLRSGARPLPRDASRRHPHKLLRLLHGTSTIGTLACGVRLWDELRNPIAKRGGVVRLLTLPSLGTKVALDDLIFGGADGPLTHLLLQELVDAALVARVLGLGGHEAEVLRVVGVGYGFMCLVLHQRCRADLRVGRNEP